MILVIQKYPDKKLLEIFSIKRMIVTSHQKGWKIINQRSHGLLAAMLAYQYDIDLPNDIIVPAIVAIAKHDVA